MFSPAFLFPLEFLDVGDEAFPNALDSLPTSIQFFASFLLTSFILDVFPKVHLLLFWLFLLGLLILMS